MQARDLILVSVDDHLVEPPDVFDHHLPARYRDRAPAVDRRADGSDVWVFDGTVIPNVGLNAVAGRPREEYGVEPTAFDEMRPGCYDVHERIKDMNAGGVLASMCFPSFPGFSARLFAASADKELATAVIRAYNDWHVDEWCGAYPGRFIPMGLPVLWDPELCAAEVRRLAANGVHSLTFTENPAALGYPSFHEEHWDPLWKALTDEGVVLSIHLGSSGQLSITAPDAPVDVMITLQPMNICQAAADLLWSRVIKRSRPSGSPCPREARAGSPTSSTGWTAPTRCTTSGRARTSAAGCRARCSGSTSSPASSPTRSGIALRHEIGLDNIAWECDYPHSDSSWPRAAEELEAVAADVPDDELAKITYENACRWYSFDPFAHRAQESCTVGALRAEAAGHDGRGPLLRQGALRPQRSRHRPRQDGGAGHGLSRPAGRQGGWPTLGSCPSAALVVDAGRLDVPDPGAEGLVTQLALEHPSDGAARAAPSGIRRSGAARSTAAGRCTSGRAPRERGTPPRPGWRSP